MLNNRDICDKYTITLRNKFDALQEISKTLTTNDEYESFVNVHMESTTECIPTRLRAKHWVPCETLAVKKKHDDVKTASLCDKRKPANDNAQELKKSQSELTNTDLKEQTEYIQDQINKVQHSVEDRQFRIAWQTVNVVSKRKRTARAKLKATC